MKLPFFVYDILKTLIENNFKAYVVGGSIRNELLKLPISDYDVTTDATPDQVKEIFSKKYEIVDTGLKHGTVTLVNYAKKTVEVTTFRTESNYKDNRHPDKVEFIKTYEEDSKRRDFTINSLYYSVLDNRILDPTNLGMKDIEKRLIRAIGDPNERFKEDGLRILRAIRFLAVLKPLGFEIEENTKKAIFENKDLLKNIAGERIREEFNKIILSDDVYAILSEYFDVISIFIPEFIKCKDFSQISKYHKYDVLNHLFYACQNSKKILHVRLACLFHDIGKPDSCVYKEKYHRNVFVNHEKHSVKIANDILERLHYNKKMKTRILTLILFHDNSLKLNKEHQLISMLDKIGPYNLLDMVEVKRGDDIGHDLKYSKNEYYDELSKYVSNFLDNLPIKSQREMDFDGSDLIKLGFKPNYCFKKILTIIFNTIINRQLENNKKAITEFVLKYFTVDNKPNEEFIKELIASKRNTIIDINQHDSEDKDLDVDEIDDATDESSNIKSILRI